MPPGMAICTKPTATTCRYGVRFWKTWGGFSLLIFRYDDYSAAERIRIDTDKALFGIFRSQKVPLTVGVTPLMVSDVRNPECETFADFRDDRVRVDLLRRGLDAGWELGLHGLTHRRSAVRDATEFAMFSRRLQSQRMQEGRERVESCFPGAGLRVFIPPWNSYDQVTVQASATNGFSVLCAGALAEPSVRAGVRIIPSTLTVPEFLTYLRIVPPRKFLSDLGTRTVVVTVHEYEFGEPDSLNEVGIRELDVAIAQLSSEGAQYGLVSQADPADCQLPERGPLLSTVEMIRKLQRSRGHTVVMLMAKQRAARGALASTFQLAATTAAASDRATEAVKKRLRPVRQGLARRRQMLTGWLRFAPRYECPFCGYTGAFAGFHGRQGLCPSCASVERHRFIVSTVGPLLKERPLRRQALMLAPDALLPMLSSSFDRVVTGDIARRNVDVTFDLENLPFRASSFDAIVAIHVLDEVENDRRALEECWRCLSPGGWLIVPVPIHDWQQTVELDERREDGKIRLAGRDYFDRIAAQGFAVAKEFDPLDDAFSDLHKRMNIRTPSCLPRSEGVVVFEKPL
ncbi:MAG: methyltransferase domain-containing protein [Polyangia bacterium]